MCGMTKHLAGWADVRQIADELELQIHLAGMDARDRWHTLQRRLARLEDTIMHSGERAASHELAHVRSALVHLRDDVVARAYSDFTAGW
jgi:hypothetical protein